MATHLTSTRSASDFSAASVISLGRSMPEDIFDSPEATPLLGHSVEISQIQKNQGDCSIAVFCTLYLRMAPSLDCAMQGGTLRLCTVGDEVNPCVARRGRPCRRSKGVSIVYGPADATATDYLLLQ